MILKFESFQKKCIKWILSEEEFSYSQVEVYIRKCKQVNILPLRQRFLLNDLRGKCKNFAVRFDRTGT